MDRIIKDIEFIINSNIEVEKKIKILLNIQNHIDEKLNVLKEKKEDEILKEYLIKYKNNKNDNIYSLEYKFDIDRDFQTAFVEILSEINIDGYGSFNGNKPNNIKNEYEKVFNEQGYENDTFYIRPYNWDGISFCDCSCGLDDAIDKLELNEYKYGFHSKDCLAWETNFYYKPTNLKIVWYKYPLRCAYSNQNLTVDVIKSILNDCVKSVILK